jgi:hypothetical protein
MLIAISQQEREALVVVLVLALRNLGEEMYNTRTLESRESLQQRKSMLQNCWSD